MNNKFGMILCVTFSLLIIRPTMGLAWHDYSEAGDDWDYHGSGRDHPYSQYIDRRNFVGYADYAPLAPDDIDPASYTLSGPAIVVPPQPDVFTVNIPNDHGGYTPIVIKRSGSGFTGPQGEYYPEFPKVFQLKIIYGK